MPRTKNGTKCSGCKKVFKSVKGATQHKKSCPCLIKKENNNKIEYEEIEDEELKKELIEEKKNYICEFCLNFINKKKKKIHTKICHKKMFFNVYLKFLDFLFKIIIINNNKIINNNIINNINDKKILIKKYLIENEKDEEKIKEIEKEYEKKDFLKNNYKIFKKIINEIKLNEIKEKYKILNDCNIEINKENEKENNKKILLINIAENQLTPLISFRKIVFLFLQNNDLTNKRIKKRINRRYKKRDWFTDSEIKQIDNETIAPKIANLYINNEEYENSFNKYYDMLISFKNDPQKYECFYCKKYILNKFKHYRKCEKARESFNNNKAFFFYNFLDKNFDEKKLKKINEREIIKKYLNKDFDFFINNIHENITDVLKFEINYEKEKEKEIYKKLKIKKLDEKKLKNISNIYFTLSILLEIDFDVKLEEKDKIFIKQNLYNEIYINKNKNYKEKIKQNFKEYLDNKLKDKNEEIEKKEELENENIEESEKIENKENEDEEPEEDEEIEEYEEPENEESEEKEDDNEEDEDEILEKKTIKEESEEEQEYNINNKEIENNWGNYYNERIYEKRKKLNKNAVYFKYILRTNNLHLFYDEPNPQ